MKHELALWLYDAHKPNHFTTYLNPGTFEKMSLRDIQAQYAELLATGPYVIYTDCLREYRIWRK